MHLLKYHPRNAVKQLTVLDKLASDLEKERRVHSSDIVITPELIEKFIRQVCQAVNMSMIFFIFFNTRFFSFRTTIIC